MHQEQSEFVRGIFNSYMSNTAKTVGTANESVRVKSWRLRGGAADEILIFRRNSGGAEYFRIPVPAWQPRIIDIPFNAIDGLEVVLASASGSFQLSIFYYDD